MLKDTSCDRAVLKDIQDKEGRHTSILRYAAGMQIRVTVLFHLICYVFSFVSSDKYKLEAPLIEQFTHSIC